MRYRWRWWIIKKKFYDFNLTTALIVILAYLFTFTLSLYMLLNQEEVKISGIIFNVLLFLSLLDLIIYFVFFPVTLKNGQIMHLRKKIPIDQLYWYVRPNYRLRYDEIIFRDRRVPYGKLLKKELRKNEIRVQYFPKYEIFLEENIGPARDNTGGTNGEK